MTPEQTSITGHHSQGVAVDAWPLIMGDTIPPSPLTPTATPSTEEQMLCGSLVLLVVLATVKPNFLCWRQTWQPPTEMTKDVQPTQPSQEAHLHAEGHASHKDPPGDKGGS